MNCDIYANCVREFAMPIMDFKVLTEDEFCKLNEWMSGDYDELLDRRCKVKPSMVKLWTRELSLMRGRSNCLRKRLQWARRTNVDDLDRRKTASSLLILGCTVQTGQ